MFAFFLVDWRSSRRRGSTFAQDRLFERLIADQRVGRLLVGNPLRSGPVFAARRLLDPRYATPAPPGVAMVTPLRLRRHDPTDVPGLERTYARYDRALAQAARRAGLRAPAVITPNPFVAAFCPLTWAASVTYYATDDWPAHHAYSRWSSAYLAAQERIAASGRRVCAVSEVIAQRIGPCGEQLVVPNGVAPAEWRSPGPPPDWFARLPSPRLLYVGTLDRRVDVGIVRRVAERFAGGSVVLLGDVADDRHLEGLRGQPNVVLHSAVGRQELASVVSAADACLHPHAITSLTEGMSPLKVYEYLAGGRPVAAVDLPPLRGLGPRLVLAPGDRFPDAVAEALSLGPAPEKERLACLKANSWERRHAAILDFALR